MKPSEELRIAIIGMGRLMETIRPCYAALLETPERLSEQVIATTIDERGLREKNARLGFTVLLGQNDKMLRRLMPDLILFAPPPHDALSLTESVLEEEGMRVFEWWGGEYRPLEELIAEMDEVKKKKKQGETACGKN